MHTPSKIRWTLTHNLLALREKCKPLHHCDATTATTTVFLLHCPSYLAKILQHFHKVFYSSPCFLVLMALVVPQWQPHMYPWESTTHSGRGPAWMWAVGGMWEWEGGGPSCDLQMDDRKDFVLSGWQRQAWRQSSLFKLCRDEMSLMAAQPGLTSLSLNVIWTQSHCATLAATWLWRQI